MSLKKKIVVTVVLGALIGLGVWFSVYSIKVITNHREIIEIYKELYKDFESDMIIMIKQENETFIRNIFSTLFYIVIISASCFGIYLTWNNKLSKLTFVKYRYEDYKKDREVQLKEKQQIKLQKLEAEIQKIKENLDK